MAIYNRLEPAAETDAGVGVFTPRHPKRIGRRGQCSRGTITQDIPVVLPERNIERQLQARLLAQRYDGTRRV